MAEGTYTPEERQQIEEVARLIVQGQKDFAEAVYEVAQRLGRSPQGVKLFLGRTVRRLNGTGGRRRLRAVEQNGEAGRRRGRRSLEWLVDTTKKKAGELRGLRREQEKIGRRIETLEAELKELQEELLRNIGLSQ